MKKIIVIFLTLILCSCNINDSNVISRTEEDIYIKFEDMFSSNFGIYYFYMNGCAACESIDYSIKEYALTDKDFYLVIPSNKFKYGYDKDLNIGVNNYEDIIITGFPSLFVVNEYKVTDIKVGVKDISNYLL